MLPRTQPIKDVQEFIGQILHRPALRGIVPVYRGHANVTFNLRPSIFRAAYATENEHILLRELIAAHPEDFTNDGSALEILVRMQHYSLPTRLLDVTLNPLVALYFACESVKTRVTKEVDGKSLKKTVEADGHVVMLAVSSARMRYFDSDTVACLTNLSRLSWDHKQGLDTGLSKEEFNTSLPAKRLVHFIKQEKSGFLPEIEPQHLNEIFLVKPKQNNKRILAQSGAFFAFGMVHEIDDDNDLGIGISRLVVNGASKANIRRQLDRLGINEKTLFPEIERAARYLTGSITPPPALPILRTLFRPV